jgi:hypothetical protein
MVITLEGGTCGVRTGKSQAYVIKTSSLDHRLEPASWRGLLPGERAGSDWNRVHQASGVAADYGSVRV